MRSVPAGTSWPSMEDDSEAATTEHSSSPVSGHDDIAALSTLPIATDVNNDVTDTPAAVSAPSSSSSESHDQRHL